MHALVACHVLAQNYAVDSECWAWTARNRMIQTRVQGKTYEGIYIYNLDLTT